MALYEIIEHFFVLLFVFCLINCHIVIATAEWIPTHSIAQYSTMYMPNTFTPNTTLVTETIQKVSLGSCAILCKRSIASSLYYFQNERTCLCNSAVDTNVDEDSTTGQITDNVIYGYVKSYIEISTNTTTRKYDIQPYKEICLAHYYHGYTTNAIYNLQSTEGNIQYTYCDMDNILDVGADDCLQWFQVGYSDDGVYNIRLSNETTVRAWCNLTGGGWTVVQRRQDGSVDFYRDWVEYVNGFGDPAGEYWLGLEAIYLLSQQHSSLLIDMEAFEGADPLTAFALYDNFRLMSATDKYRLRYDIFTGDCGDGLNGNIGRKFTTRDNDNDAQTYNCAHSNYWSGAWWYRWCTKSNLNGIYRNGVYSGVANGIVWENCWGSLYSMKSCSMEIKRN